MSFTFTKLFSSITSSTIWVESPEIKVVWITMLAMADRKGRVFASIPGLAKDAVVSVEATRKAIAMFLAPDPDSRTKDYEGRRIEEIDGGWGWRLLNYGKYREIRDEEDRREYLRLHKANSRLKAATPRTVPSSVAESVLTAVSISDPRMVKVIADAIETHVKANPDWSPERTAARMIEGYQAYAAAAQELRFTLSARKFFSQGWWLDSKLWPFQKQRRII